MARIYSITPTIGSKGSTKVTVTAEPNPGRCKRTGEIKFTADSGETATLTVDQSGELIFTEPSALTETVIPSAGGQVRFSCTGNARTYEITFSTTAITDISPTKARLVPDKLEYYDSEEWFDMIPRSGASGSKVTYEITPEIDYGAHGNADIEFRMTFGRNANSLNGFATVTFSATGDDGDGNDYDAVTYKIELTQEAGGISVSPSSVTLNANGDAQEATVSGDAWTSEIDDKM